MIPILLLDLAGVILVIGYVLLDRRNTAGHGPSADHHDRAQAAAGTPSLPIEPIVAQRPLPADVEPRRIKRPQRGGARNQPADADPSQRS